MLSREYRISASAIATSQKASGRGFRLKICTWDRFHFRLKTALGLCHIPLALHPIPEPLRRPQGLGQPQVHLRADAAILIQHLRQRQARHAQPRGCVLGWTGKTRGAHSFRRLGAFPFAAALTCSLQQYVRHLFAALGAAGSSWKFEHFGRIKRINARHRGWRGTCRHSWPRDDDRPRERHGSWPRWFGKLGSSPKGEGQEDGVGDSGTGYSRKGCLVPPARVARAADLQERPWCAERRRWAIGCGNSRQRDRGERFSRLRCLGQLQQLLLGQLNFDRIVAGRGCEDALGIHWIVSMAGDGYTHRRSRL